MLRQSTTLLRQIQITSRNLPFCTSSSVFGQKSYSKIRYSKRILEIMSESSEKVKTIGTHDGRFHCDEALACFMLQRLDQYKDAEIIRTRKDDILDTCDIVVDVGSVFDKEKNRFDHHQQSFSDTLSSLRPEFGKNYNVRLSSAGLIYVYFGEDIISAILQQESGLELDKKSLMMIYRMIYEKFIQEIDAIDNGVPMFPGEPTYTINTNINSRVQDLNQKWKVVKEPYDSNVHFRKAMELVGGEFIEKILYYTESWLPARSIVETALINRHKIHESGSIIELDQFCPWKEHLAQLEVEHNIEGTIKYVLFNERPSDFRVMAVPINPDSLTCRKFLHKDWRGLREAELEKLSGIQGINFVHHNGFIGGAFNRNASLEMAVKSLQGDYTD
uniref:Uncharacterized protein n=1 Tax=Phlebotomus papatasi TaxID=29031 RepID=A0A1B0D999_PHLPP